ncbi:MAG: hypothetical protein JWL66_1623 [Sphingomonadales bacterium]|nr:hypothetical protein [Sphingomonadales bacterium]
MIIVQYLNHSCNGNGHVAVAVDLACEQVRDGHDVYFVSGYGDFDDLLAQHGVKILTLGDPSGTFRLPIMAWRFLWAVFRIRPDIVNAHMVYAALAARMVKWLVGYRLITTVHNSFDRQASLMRVGDLVIAVSDAVNCDMEQRGVPAKQLRTVTNGTIGGARRPAYTNTPELLQHPAVVTVCGLHSRKGVAHLIDGFDAARLSFPEAHLYVVGGGPEGEAFEAQARKTASADHIHFMGYRADPRDILATADVFVLASLRDPCPLVIFEAREMGNPIIATSVDGIPAALNDGRAGLLVPPADPDAIARAVVRILSDDELRATLSHAARQDLEDMTVRRMSRQTVDVYAESLR